jgi:hypothetical protein
MSGIADWLASIGLEEYTQRFTENAIAFSSGRLAFAREAWMGQRNALVVELAKWAFGGPPWRWHRAIGGRSRSAANSGLAACY